MFELFNGVSDGELKDIYKDIKKSEKDGLRPKSLDSYAKKLQKICKFEVFSQSIDFTKELFYKEIAKRYSQNNDVSMSIYYSFRLIPKRYESFLFAVNVSFGIRFHLSSKI